MNILQICHKPPYPPVDGGTIAMNNITSGLLENGFSVKILCITTPKHPLNFNALPDNYIKSTSIESVFIDTSIKLHKAFFNLFSSKSYNIVRFISREFEEKLMEILQSTAGEFDIIQLESIFVSPYLQTIRKYFPDGRTKIVLRTHNIEHLIWERTAETEKNPIKRWYLSLLARRLKKYELRIFSCQGGIDAIVAISTEDEKKIRQLGCSVPIITIPIGFNLSESNIQYPTSNIQLIKPLSLFYIGSMDWMPNYEGIQWFLHSCWDKIHQKYPELKFYIAGRQTHKKLKNLNYPNVIIVGEVENSADFIGSKDIMIVPLLAGSGIRVKIIEAMSLGKAVITSSIGAEGVNAMHQKDILIADTADEFVNIISACVDNPRFCETIGMNAKGFALANFNNKKLIEKLVEFYKGL